MRKASFYQVCKKLSGPCAVAALLAFLYSYWKFTQSADFPKAVDTFGLAFFFVMYFIGQYLRAAKQITDAENSVSLQLLGDKVDGLKSEIVDGIASKMAVKVNVMQDIEGTSAARNTGATSNEGKDVLVVVDVQKDFCAGGVLQAHDTESLIQPLNTLIKCAQAGGFLVVFTRDWHPKDHNSFETVGGVWPSHCVQGEAGATFHPALFVPEHPVIVDIGTDKASLGYSPFEDPKMKEILADSAVRNIYVTGIALEYCILATCLDALQCGKPVVALEPYIRAATSDAKTLEDQWGRLTSKGVIRAHKMGVCAGVPNIALERDAAKSAGPLNLDD